MSASHASTLLGTRVLLLKGGPDAEREVSLKSGTMVAAALRRAAVGRQRCARALRAALQCPRHAAQPLQRAAAPADAAPPARRWRCAWR
jgi:hypothetical protein